MNEYEQWKIHHCANIYKCWHCKYDNNCKEFTAMAIKEFTGRKDKKEGKQMNDDMSIEEQIAYELWLSEQPEDYQCQRLGGQYE